jgi:SAM-dependent methyltransferase
VTAEATSRIAALFPARWDRHYSATKLRSDPLYEAVAAELAGSSLPLLDLGCGLGLLAFYLRENGHGFPVTGLDYDGRKILGASKATTRSGFSGLVFREHDARTGLPGHSGNVTILDILQFFGPEAQAALITEAAKRVAPGGKLVIRSGLRDDSWRFKVTVAGDWVAKATFWMKATSRSAPCGAPRRSTTT